MPASQLPPGLWEGRGDAGWGRHREHGGEGSLTLSCVNPALPGHSRAQRILLSVPILTRLPTPSTESAQPAEGWESKQPWLLCRDWVLLFGQRAGGSSCSSGTDSGMAAQDPPRGTDRLAGSRGYKWRHPKDGEPSALWGRRGCWWGKKITGEISSRNFVLSHKNPH